MEANGNMKYAILICASLAIAGCDSRTTSPEAAVPDLRQLSGDLERVEKALAKMENRVTHLET